MPRHPTIMQNRSTIVRLASWLAGLAILGGAAGGLALDVTDPFTAGSAAWSSTAGWSLVEAADGSVVFRGDSQNDGFARNLQVALGSSWRIESDVVFRKYYADGQGRGVASIALFPGLGSGVQFLANINHRTNDAVELNVQWFDTSRALWLNSILTAWQPNRTSTYRIQLTRPAGSDRVSLVVSSPNGFTNRIQSSAIPADVLNRMGVFGLRVNSAQVAFDNVRVITPYQLPPAPRILQQPVARRVAVGAPVRMQVGAEPGVPLQYQWFRNGIRIRGATSSELVLDAALPVHQGDYTVEVSNGETTTLSNPALLTVLDARLGIAPGQHVGFPLQISAAVGLAYTLQESLDLRTWTDLANAVGTGNPVVLSVPVKPEGQQGYYRLVLP